MKKVLFALIVCVFAVMPLTAAGQEEMQSEADGKVTLDFQIWVTPNLTVEYWETLANEFMRRNPNIEVNLVQAITGESTADNFLRTRLAAGNMPDVCHVFTEELFIDAGAFMELPVDEDIKRMRNLDGMLKDGKLYTYDSITLIHGMLYYNKDKFADAGITSVPADYEEFDTVLKKLKNNGYVPMMVAGADWTAGFHLSIFSAPQVFYNNTQWYKDRNDGKVSFFDEDWQIAAERFKNYIDENYFFEGASGVDYPTGQQLFLDGKGAIYPMGSWFSGSPEAINADFEIGAFAPPTEDGGSYLSAPANRNGYAVSADTEHPEEAIALAKFMGIDPFAVKKRLALEGGFPDMENADDYMYEMNPIQQEVYEVFKNTDVMTNNLNHPVGDPAPAGLEDALTKAAQNMFTGGSVQESLQMLETFWDKSLE